MSSLQESQEHLPNRREETTQRTTRKYIQEPHTQSSKNKNLQDIRLILLKVTETIKTHRAQPPPLRGNDYEDGRRPLICSSAIQILNTFPMRRKNFLRTARSSGIRSNCMISHKCG